MSKKKPLSKEEADRLYESTVAKVNGEFGAGMEQERKKLAKLPKKYDRGEGMRELPTDVREKHLKD